MCSPCIYFLILFPYILSRNFLLSAFCSVVVYWTTLSVNIHSLIFCIFISFFSLSSLAICLLFLPLFLFMPDSASFVSCSFIRPFSLVVSSFFLFYLPIRFLVVLCFCLLPSSAASPSSSPIALKLMRLCTCLFSSHSILIVALFPGVNWQGPEVGSFLHLPASLKEWVELCLHSTVCLCGMHRHNFTYSVFLFFSFVNSSFISF